MRNNETSVPSQPESPHTRGSLIAAGSSQVLHAPGRHHAPPGQPGPSPRGLTETPPDSSPLPARERVEPRSPKTPRLLASQTLLPVVLRHERTLDAACAITKRPSHHGPSRRTPEGALSPPGPLRYFMLQDDTTRPVIQPQPSTPGPDASSSSPLPGRERARERVERPVYDHASSADKASNPARVIQDSVLEIRRTPEVSCDSAIRRSLSLAGRGPG